MVRSLCQPHGARLQARGPVVPDTRVRVCTGTTALALNQVGLSPVVCHAYMYNVLSNYYMLVLNKVVYAKQLYNVLFSGGIRAHMVMVQSL